MRQDNNIDLNALLRSFIGTPNKGYEMRVVRESVHISYNGMADWIFDCFIKDGTANISYGYSYPTALEVEKFNNHEQFLEICKKIHNLVQIKE
jgi:hypothetical protein